MREHKLRNRLSSGSYFPPPVHALEMPKRDGSPRLLRVPDRIAQTVVAGYLEPGMEPIFHRASSGYRPGRSRWTQWGLPGALLATGLAS
jgi:RNA-directed DNA polymerase